MTNYYRKSFYRSHNLEVPGSSPGWSTLKSSTYKNFVGAFSFIGDPQVTFFSST